MEKSLYFVIISVLAMFSYCGKKKAFESHTAITPQKWATQNAFHVSVKYDGTDLKTVFFPGSGHPSFHPKGLPLIVTDAYPDEALTKKNGIVPIRLLHTDTQKEENIAEVFVSQQNGEFRIDPHPAWDRSGRYIIFNGYVGDTRNVYIADMKNIISIHKK